MITPLGRTVAENWQAVLDSKSAIRFIRDMHGPCKIGGRLPEYDLPETSMNSVIHSMAKALADDCVQDGKIDLRS